LDSFLFDMVGGPLGITLAPYIYRRPALLKALTPFAQAYINWSGYRKIGLRYDDLLIEERSDVQKAIQRLAPEETNDRAFRIRRAFQADLMRRQLPKDQWTKPEEDVRYLTPYIEEAYQEDQERAAWDNMEVKVVRKAVH